jgi:hypothetical protein
MSARILREFIKRLAACEADSLQQSVSPCRCVDRAMKDRLADRRELMLTNRYLALIRTVAECRVLTTGQFAMLEFGSEQAARRAVRAMASQDLLHLGYDRPGRQRGRPEQLLSLKPLAVQVLKKSGALPKDTNTEDAQAGPLEEFLDHQLMLNWVRIAVQELLKARPDFGAVFVSSTSPFRAQIPGALDSLNMALPCSDGTGGPSTVYPDAVLIMSHRPSQRSLLFFVEVDMSTESVASPSGKPNDIRQKLINYRIALGRKLYKSCERIVGVPLTGFRVLFVANTLERASVLCRLAAEMAPMDFVWITDHGRLRGSGLHGAIWHRGSRADVADQSVLGSVASCVGAPPLVEPQRT